MILGICGNIGAGKSSLSNLLIQNFSLQPLLEKFKENPYLEYFYKDMNRWAFHSQLFFLIKKIEFMDALKENGLIYVQDRTIYEDVFVFAKNLNKLGYISEKDWKMYFDVFSLFENKILNPSCLIYIKCNLETLKKRIMKRGRKFEQNISDTYLNSLNNLYNEWFEESSISNKFIIDGNNYDFIEERKDREQILNYISEKICKMSYGIQSMLF